MKKNLLLTILVTLSLTSLTACQAGKVLDYNSVQTIQRNITTEQQIRAQFGEPVAVHVDSQTGTKTLLYRYTQNDEIKKPIAGLVGAIAGGVIGYQIGGGFGQTISTTVGTAAGGALAQNAITTREHTRNLSIMINLQTNRVIDYRYTEDSSRSQSWRPGNIPPSL